MNKTLRLLALVAAFVPTFALADENFPQLTVHQDWCKDGSYRFVVEGSTPATSDERECVALAQGTLEFPFAVRMNEVVDGPVGNFLNRLYATQLGRPDMSFKGAPTETREYWVRAGNCGSTSVFAVQTVVPTLLPDGLNLNREICDFSRSTQISTNLPIAGVYPRNGRSLNDFIQQLLK